MLPDTRYKNYRILVVDDEQRMAKFIRLNLEHDGFRVVEAFTGTQAMDKLSNFPPRSGFIRCDAPRFGWV